MKRIYYLDNIKSLLVAFVVLAHAIMPYIPFEQWLYQTSNPMERIPYSHVLVTFFTAFIISLFSFLSGLFCVASYNKNGCKKFLYNKLKRLGVPLVLGGLIYTVSLGGYNLGHLWYLEVLLLFCFAYCFARLFVHIEHFSVKPIYQISCLFVWACVMGLITFGVRQIFPYNMWTRNMFLIFIEPAHFPQYLLMFVLGIYAYHSNLVNQMSNRMGMICLFIGILLMMGLFWYGDSYEKYLNSRLFSVHESFIAVFFNMGLLWFFKQHVNIYSKVSDFFQQQAYGVHIIHVPILLGFQVLFDPLNINVFFKFVIEYLLALGASCAVIWLLRKNSIIKGIL